MLWNSGWITIFGIKARWLVDACFKADDTEAVVRLVTAIIQAFREIWRSSSVDDRERTALRILYEEIERLFKSSSSHCHGAALDTSSQLLKIALGHLDWNTEMTKENEQQVIDQLGILAGRLWAAVFLNEEKSYIDMVPIRWLAGCRMSKDAAHQVDTGIANVILALEKYNCTALATAMTVAWRDAPERIGSAEGNRKQSLRALGERLRPLRRLVTKPIGTPSGAA